MLSIIARRFNRKYFHSLFSLNKHIRIEFRTARSVGVKRALPGNSRKSFSNVESNSAVTKETGPVDFFGIESDEGVIHVSNKTASFKREMEDGNSSNSSNMEHVLKTSFGLLRFDSENRPEFHGQFEENLEDTECSYGNNTQIERIQNIRTSSKHGMPTNLKQFYMVTSSKKQTEESSSELQQRRHRKPRMLVKNDGNMFEKWEGNDIDSRLRIHAEPSDVAQENGHTRGFIDRMYFDSGIDEIPNSNTSTSLSTSTYSEEPSMGQDINIWRGYSDKIPKSRGTESQILKLPENLDNQSLSHEESSFIDSLYFGELSSVDNDCLHHSNATLPKDVASFIEVKQNLADDCTADLKTQRNANIDMSFIDSSYFGSAVEKGSSSFHEENPGVTPQSECINESDALVYESKDPGNAITNFALENTFPIKEKVNSVVKSKEVTENLCFPAVKESHPDMTENKTYSLSKDFSKGTEKISELEREILLAEKELGLQSTTNGGEDKSETAYNYVLKLRNTKMKDYDQSGKELMPEMHKTFKDQVPDLSHLTRNELLDFLKDCVLFSNDDVVILNKPYNLVVHESQTTRVPSLSSVLDDLASRLDTSASHPQLYTVHRLDKETTGCLLLARNELAAQHLKSLFAKREILKTYLAITSRVPDPLEGVINIPIAEGKIENKTRMVLQPDIPSGMTYKTHVKNGKKAVTYYKVISTSENAALVEVKPETGLKHQIRVHLGFGLNCPVLGDHKYSHLTKMAPQRLPGDILRKLGIQQSKVRYLPLHMHARNVIIPKFLKGEDLFISAPLPEHFRARLKRLKFKKD